MSSLSPDPFPCFSFRRCVHAFAVLFSILPIPCINLSTGPRKFPHSMFFVFIVFTYIGFTIRPCEGTPPVHHVLFPLSPILSLVFPHINSDSIYGIIFEITIIFASVCPFKAAFASLFSSYVLAIKYSSISPLFSTQTFLLIIYPFSVEDRPIYMGQHAFPMCMIIFPITYIVFPIGMYMPSKSICPVILKLPFIDSSICKH